LAGAERHLDEVSGDERPEWMYDFDRPRFDAHAGACYLRMGRPVEAEPVLRRALAGLPPGGRRRADVSLDLAGALLGAGETEEAVDLAGQATDHFGAWDSAAGLDRVAAPRSATQAPHAPGRRSRQSTVPVR
jgi:hypothetical protein